MIKMKKNKPDLTYKMPPLSAWVKPGKDLPSELFLPCEVEPRPSFVPLRQVRCLSDEPDEKEYVFGRNPVVPKDGFYHLSTREAHVILLAKTKHLRDPDIIEKTPRLCGTSSFACLLGAGCHQDYTAGKLRLVETILAGRVAKSSPSGRDKLISPQRKGYYTKDGGWIIPHEFRVDRLYKNRVHQPDAASGVEAIGSLIIP